MGIGGIGAACVGGWGRVGMERYVWTADHPISLCFVLVNCVFLILVHVCVRVVFVEMICFPFSTRGGESISWTKTKAATAFRYTCTCNYVLVSSLCIHENL